MTAVAIRFRARVPYDAGVSLQDALVRARQEGRIPDTVLFLEHTPVITLGRRGRSGHLLVSKDRLAEKGIDLAVSSRGGDVTYHGPGQWVMYPILKLGDAEADSHGYLWNLEEIAVRTAADFGVQAYRREGMSGAWTDAGKIAAIGFHLRRWVTQHGMSFNVRAGLDGFGLIVGCGLVGERVSSLQEILGPTTPAMEDVLVSLSAHASGILGRPFLSRASDHRELAGILDASGLDWEDRAVAPRRA